MMIEKMRKPKKSKSIFNYVLYAIVFGMIIATFVFMIPGLGGGGGAVNTAAEVGNSTISLRDYTDQLRVVRGQYQKMFNGEIPPFFEAGLKRQVLDSLVKQEVVSQYARENDVIISDLEVGEVLKKDIPAFQEDGVFSYSRYNGYLKSVRTSANKFEEKIYKDLISKKIYQAFESSVAKSPLEEKMEATAKSVKVKFQYVKLEDDKIQKTLKVSDTDVQTVLSDDSSLKGFEETYNKQKNLYKNPKQVDVGYLLIKDKAAADQVSQELNSKTFSDLAVKHSEDTLSKNKGGALGYISKGSFNTEVEDKAFSMKKGEVSKPFKTALGYVMLHVKNIKPEGVKSFNDVKELIAKEYLQSKGVSSFKKNLQESLKKSAAEAESVFKNANLSWSPEKEFSLEGESLPDIGADEEIISKVLALGAGQVHPGILSFKGQEFIVKKNSLENNKLAEAADVVAQNKTVGRGGALLDLVYQNKKKALNVQTNQQLLK